MELRTPCFTARFDKARCNFVSLVNLGDGDEYLKRPPRSPIVELYALRGTDKVRLLPALNIPMAQLEQAIGVLKAVCAEV